MLINILNNVKAEHLQHDQKQAQNKARIMRRCESLRLELLRHPEKTQHLEAVIERAEAELRKMGGG